MLTLFTTAKPFTDARIAAIQRNACTSWTLLRPRPEIMLFGDEPGTAEVARDLGLRHMRRVARSPSGVPLLGDMFLQAEREAAHDLLCYVNADIILLDDFMAAVARLTAWRERWLLIGGRLDLDLCQPLDFDAPDWQARLAWQARLQGIPMTQGSDYFAFPRGLYPRVPPFAPGRTAWDNWLIWWPRQAGIPVIDATHRVTAVHQGLNSSQVVGATAGSPDGRRNAALAGPWATSFTPADADYELTLEGVRPRHLASRLNRLEIAADLALRPVRRSLRRLGLRQHHLRRLRDLVQLEAHGFHRRPAR